MVRRVGYSSGRTGKHGLRLLHHIQGVQRRRDHLAPWHRRDEVLQRLGLLVGHHAPCKCRLGLCRVVVPEQWVRLMLRMV